MLFEVLNCLLHVVQIFKYALYVKIHNFVDLAYVPLTCYIFGKLYCHVPKLVELVDWFVIEYPQSIILIVSYSAIDYFNCWYRLHVGLN